MAAGKYNFTIEQGATWRREIQVQDESDNPVNLTGHIVRMQLRTAHAARTALITLTTVSPAHGITVDALTGTITLELTDEETAILPPRELVYDVEIENPSGEVQRILQGTATVDPEVTR